MTDEDGLRAMQFCLAMNKYQLRKVKAVASDTHSIAAFFADLTDEGMVRFNLALEKMKYFYTILVLVVASFANAQDNLVSIDSEHSLRIPNHRVTVVIDNLGGLTLATRSMKKDLVTTTKHRLTEKELSLLEKQLASVNWSKAREDKVIGVDGTTVSITYKGAEISLWAPQYDSRKRGIKKLQNAIEQIFKLAGLGKSGMPLKNNRNSSK